MIYSFYCNSCKQDFELNLTLKDYIDHAPKRNGDVVIAKFFRCTHCNSADTWRAYTYAPPAIYRGEGFTKSHNKED